MDKLVPAFETTLFDSTLSDACSDLAELGIDSLLDDGLFKSIPVVSLLIGVGKTAQNLFPKKKSINIVKKYNPNLSMPKRNLAELLFF